MLGKLASHFSQKTTRYGTEANSYDLLKVMAIVIMFIDHTGWIFFDGLDAFRAIGRAALPLFMFLVGYGYSESRKADLMLVRCCMLLIALDVLTHFSILPLDALFTILISRYVLRYAIKKGILNHDLMDHVIWFLPLILFYPLFAPIIGYSTPAIMIVFCGYLFRQQPAQIKNRILMAITLCFYALVQIYEFRFGAHHATLVCILVASLYCMFYDFKIVPLTIRPAFAKRLFLLTSRHSLGLYVSHLIVLQCLAWYLYPARYHEFSWL